MYKRPVKDINEEKLAPFLKLEEGKRRHYHENLWQFLYDPITKVLAHLVGHGMTQAGQFKRTGLSQPVETLNTLSFYSQLRRLQEHKTLFKKSSDICYDLSQAGFICPIETPDNHNVGRVMQLSGACQLSRVEDEERVKTLLTQKNVTVLSDMQDLNTTLVFLNGDIFGGLTGDV